MFVPLPAVDTDRVAAREQQPTPETGAQPPSGEPARSTHSLTGPAGPTMVEDVRRLFERVQRSHPSLVEAERTRFETAVIKVVSNLATIRATSSGSRRTTMTVLVSCERDRLLADVRGDATPDYSEPAAVELPAGIVYERSPGGTRWRVTCLRGS